MKSPVRPAHGLHAAALAAAAAFAVGGLAAVVAAQPRDDAVPTDGVLTYDAGGYRYAYHVVTGDESLFDLRADPRELHDLSRIRPALARELRGALESQLHVDALDSLRNRAADKIRTLQSLGYL